MLLPCLLSACPGPAAARLPAAPRDVRSAPSCLPSPPAPRGPGPRSSPLQRGDAAGVLGLAAGDSVRHLGSLAQPLRCFVLLLGSGGKKLVSLRVGGVILPVPVHAVRAGWGQQAHPCRARTESTIRQHQGRGMSLPLGGKRHGESNLSSLCTTLPFFSVLQWASKAAISLLLFLLWRPWGWGQ